MNGTVEHWPKSIKAACIRPGTPLSPEEARRLAQGYVDRYIFITGFDSASIHLRQSCEEGDQGLLLCRRQP